MALAAIPIGLAVVGGAMSIAKGYSQAGAYKTQAAEYQQQQRLVALQAKADEANRLDQLNRAIGTNRALAAAGNIAVESPTTVAMENANRDIASRNIAYAQTSAGMEQMRLATAAASDQSAANWAVMGGYMSAAQSIFSAGMTSGMIGGPSAGGSDSMASSGGLGAGTMASGADY